MKKEKFIKLFDGFIQGGTLEIFNEESGEIVSKELKSIISSKTNNKYKRFKTYNNSTFAH
jgi:hypothetical protein